MKNSSTPARMHRSEQPATTANTHKRQKNQAKGKKKNTGNNKKLTAE